MGREREGVLRMVVGRARKASLGAVRCGALLIDNLPAVSEAVGSLVVSECNLLRMACYC